MLLDPRGILERGYAIALDTNGCVVNDPATLTAGQRVIVEVARGRFASTVTDLDPD